MVAITEAAVERPFLPSRRKTGGKPKNKYINGSCFVHERCRHARLLAYMIDVCENCVTMWKSGLRQCFTSTTIINNDISANDRWLCYGRLVNTNLPWLACMNSPSTCMYNTDNCTSTQIVMNIYYTAHRTYYTNWQHALYYALQRENLLKS